jgi:hypothetical protein
VGPYKPSQGPGDVGHLRHRLLARPAETPAVRATGIEPAVPMAGPALRRVRRVRVRQPAEPILPPRSRRCGTASSSGLEVRHRRPVTSWVLRPARSELAAELGINMAQIPIAGVDRLVRLGAGRAPAVEHLARPHPSREPLALSLVDAAVHGVAVAVAITAHRPSADRGEILARARSPRRPPPKNGRPPPPEQGAESALAGSGPPDRGGGAGSGELGHHGGSRRRSSSSKRTRCSCRVVLRRTELAGWRISL